jgi:hypothetical protein
MDIVFYFTSSTYCKLFQELQDLKLQLEMLPYIGSEHQSHVRKDLLEIWLENAVLISAIEVDTRHNLRRGFRDIPAGVITKLVHLVCDVQAIRTIIGACKPNFIRHLHPPTARYHAVHRLVRNPKYKISSPQNFIIGGRSGLDIMMKGERRWVFFTTLVTGKVMCLTVRLSRFCSNQDFSLLLILFILKFK